MQAHSVTLRFTFLELQQSLQRNSFEIGSNLQILLSQGPGLDIQDASGRTPLCMLAMGWKPYGMISNSLDKFPESRALKRLLDETLDFEAQDNEGHTQMGYIVLERNHKSVGLLLKAGVNADGRNSAGKTIYAGQ